MLLLLVAIPSAIPTIGHDAMLKLFWTTGIVKELQMLPLYSLIFLFVWQRKPYRCHIPWHIDVDFVQKGLLQRIYLLIESQYKLAVGLTSTLLRLWNKTDQKVKGLCYMLGKEWLFWSYSVLAMSLQFCAKILFMWWEFQIHTS